MIRLQIPTIRWCYGTTCGLIMLLVTACGSTPPNRAPSMSIKIAAIKQHTERAETLEQSGEWAAALRAWWVVDALAPNHYRASERINTLNAQLDREAYRALAAGRDAAQRGRTKTAIKHALTALSLRPDLPEAQTLLRNAEKKAANRRAMRRREELSVLRAP